MYSLNDAQIEKILNDLRIHGVETEDLQLNLLDHICCIVEQEYKEQSDFNSFCQEIYPRFYKRGFREIEEETQLLLTFKHYYAMKKFMIISGMLSALSIITGSILKFLHLPFAGILLVLGMGFFTLLFLPIMFTLKFRESKHLREKSVLMMAIPMCMLIVTSVLFKIMHWPGANVMMQSSLLFTIFVFIPIYLFTGLRNPDTRTNTLTTSILLIAGSGLFLSLATVMKSQSTIEGEKRKIGRLEFSIQQQAAYNQDVLQNIQSDTLIHWQKNEIEFLNSTMNTFQYLETEKKELLKQGGVQTPEEETSKSVTYFRNKSGKIEQELNNYQLNSKAFLGEKQIPDFEVDLHLSPGSSLLDAYIKLCDLQRDLLDNFNLVLHKN